MDHEFGRPAGAVVGREDREVAQLLPVADPHVAAEFAEPGLAQPVPALVHPVLDLLGQAGEHPLGVAGVEGVVVAADQGEGGLAGHGRLLRGESSGSRGRGEVAGGGVGAESDLEVRRARRGGGRKGFQWVGCGR